MDDRGRSATVRPPEKVKRVAVSLAKMMAVVVVIVRASGLVAIWAKVQARDHSTLRLLWLQRASNNATTPEGSLQCGLPTRGLYDRSRSSLDFGSPTARARAKVRARARVVK